MTLIIAIHVIICTLLIIIILIQRGHGGGLVEGLSSLDSMFGTKTNTFLSKSTTVLSTLFLFTCLTLTIISARQSRSLMEKAKPEQTQMQVETQAQPEVAPQTQTTPEVKPQPEVPAKSETTPQPTAPPQPEAIKTE